MNTQRYKAVYINTDAEYWLLREALISYMIARKFHPDMRTTYALAAERYVAERYSAVLDEGFKKMKIDSTIENLKLAHKMYQTLTD